jgi:hypothetical protein
MNNIQLFRKEKDDISNFNIWSTCNDLTLRGLKDFFSDAYNTVSLGEILYDNKYIELSKAVKKEMFSKIYNVIFSSFAKLGTYESLITIIKSVFGEDAKIKFENSNACELHISVGQHGIDSVNWVTKDGKNIVSKSGANLIFQACINQISMEWVINLFNQFLRPTGVHYSISIAYTN